ncbi:LmrA/YxaF family transcription factor, partial [Streptomyces collinus]
GAGGGARAPGEGAAADAATGAAAAAAFAAWRGPVAEALAGMGVPAGRADPLATLMISTLEGAILMARAEQDVRPLLTVTGELGPLLDAAVVRPA